MRDWQLNGKDILAIGFPAGKAIGIALGLAQSSELSREGFLSMLTSILHSPESYSTHGLYAGLASALLSHKAPQSIVLREAPLPYQIYGAEAIEEGALQQMRQAMTLPITRGGALMPDAHQGYGLPIGGVLATENAVIPYAVGVDIGCRMCLSVFDLPASRIEDDRLRLKKLLLKNTMFGRDSFRQPGDHEVLSDVGFTEIAFLKDLKDKAARQIGSSGGGNHFVEFGIVELKSALDGGIAGKQYLALLSHSGSRGFGATIANHYTKVARRLCSLPDNVRHLAWLDLDSEEGQEYWQAMELAGAYASACHDQIHRRISRELGEQAIVRVENHHNFAWKETSPDGSDVIIHRKGATPATKGVLGIIPGSQTAPGFVVRGKGAVASLNSAAHGAGRTMSRTFAKKTLDPHKVQAARDAAGVEVIGSGLDEAPMAYKDIHEVMAAQKDLVEIVGTFQPRIVRMCGDKAFRAVD